MDRSSPFEEQLTALLPRLRRFAHALSRNFADADDLAQMAVERALRSRTQWQPGTRLDSWLYKITRNLWIDSARVQSRRKSVEASADQADMVGEDPRQAMDAALDLRRTMLVMQRLPEEQREIVALILIEGFSYREVAEMLELPIGTVSSRLVRGRTALLAMMGEP